MESINPSDKLAAGIHQTYRKWYAEVIGEKISRAMRIRAQQMAKVCNKKHKHYSRCEVPTRG